MKIKKEYLGIGIGLFLIIILAIILISIFSNKNKEENNTQYSNNAIKVMKEQNVFNKITEKEYSKTVETMLNEKLFKEEYLDTYYAIEYNDMTGFAVVVNKFLEKKYNAKEINYIIKNYKEHLNILLNMEYVDILQFNDISNFDIEKIERYLKYQEEQDYDLKTVVTYVNIGLDLKGYSSYIEYTEEEAQSDLTILVNKYHKLPDNYEPNDLVPLSYNKQYKLRQEAAEAFQILTNAALLDNVVFYPFSPYRSFETQAKLYNNYKNRDGEQKADTYSARPGFSEHQLGLAVDVRSNTLNDNLTPEHYEWMLNNSYKYGFIVRYPKGKQHITQFIEEPWHLRYLGIDLATKVHNSNLTYDEYYDIYMKNK